MTDLTAYDVPVALGSGPRGALVGAQSHDPVVIVAACRRAAHAKWPTPDRDAVVLAVLANPATPETLRAALRGYGTV